MAEFRKEYAAQVKDLLPQDHKRAFIETDVINVLINKDHLGRRVLILKQGHNWDPEQISTHEIFQLLYLSKF